MLYAVVARCPVFGGKVARFDATKAKAVAGVTHVVQIPQGVAVVASNTWAAMEGRRALQIEWDEGPNATLTAAGIRELFVTLTMKPGARRRATRRRRRGVALAGQRDSRRSTKRRISRTRGSSRMPASRRCADGGCEVWTGTQIPGQAHSTAVQASGLPPASVQVHTTYMGGSFGSRGGGAFVAEAVEIAKAVGVPVNLTYSRDDELQHDLYRPASARAVHGGARRRRLAGGVDRAHRLSDVDGAAQRRRARERRRDRRLRHPEHPRRVSRSRASPIPTGYWRSVGLSQNTFFAESFVDELAARGGKDPVALRRRLYAKSPRLLAVLDLAAEKAGWGTPLPAGRFRGVAAVAGFGSFNAQVAEISIEQGRSRVHRVVCVVDCGRVVNPIRRRSSRCRARWSTA